MEIVLIVSLKIYLYEKLHIGNIYMITTHMWEIIYEFDLKAFHLTTTWKGVR